MENLTELNKEKGLPRTYRFNPFIRWTTILIALFALSYSLWMVLFKITEDTSTMWKYLPFAIMFLTINSLMKNVFTLNSVKIQKDCVKFGYLLKKSVVLKWSNITKMEFYAKRIKAIKFHYTMDDSTKTFFMPLVLPKMLEIINSIAQMCPNAEYDEFLNNVIVKE